MWQFWGLRSRPRGFRSAGKFFTQDLKLEPLLLCHGNVLLELCKRGGGSFEGGAVPRIKFRIVELCPKRIDLGLECSNGPGQRIECMLFLKTHPPLPGRRRRNIRNRFLRGSLRFLFGAITEG